MKTRLIKQARARLKGAVAGSAIAALFVALAGNIGSETLTLSTTYPSPTGIYKTMITTDQTTLAKSQGNVILVPGGGKVGVGTPSPQASLDVQGTVSMYGTRTGLLPFTAYGPAASDGIVYVNGRLDGTAGEMTVTLLVSPDGASWWNAGASYSTNLGGQSEGTPNVMAGGACTGDVCSGAYGGSVQLAVPIRKGEFYMIQAVCYAYPNAGSCGTYSYSMAPGTWWIGVYNGYFVPMGHS